MAVLGHLSVLIVSEAEYGNSYAPQGDAYSNAYSDYGDYGGNSYAAESPREPEELVRRYELAENWQAKRARVEQQTKMLVCCAKSSMSIYFNNSYWNLEPQGLQPQLARSLASRAQS